MIPLLMCQIDHAFAEQVKANPTETFRVILRVEGDMDAREEQLQEQGFTITRRSRLIHGYAASATGAAIQRAAKEEWVVSIEPDGTVHTMKDGKKE